MVTIPEHPEVELPYLQGEYIIHLPDYLKTINARIKLEKTFVQLPLRKQDKATMNIVVKLDFDDLKI